MAGMENENPLWNGPIQLMKIQGQAARTLSGPDNGTSRGAPFSHTRARIQDERAGRRSP
jgi:hypothetical protein